MINIKNNHLMFILYDDKNKRDRYMTCLSLYIVTF